MPDSVADTLRPLVGRTLASAPCPSERVTGTFSGPDGTVRHVVDGRIVTPPPAVLAEQARLPADVVELLMGYHQATLRLADMHLRFAAQPGRDPSGAAWDRQQARGDLDLAARIRLALGDARHVPEVRALAAEAAAVRTRLAAAAGALPDADLPRQVFGDDAGVIPSDAQAPLFGEPA